MKLTVLGKSPAWTDAGGAGSGYLLEEGDTRVLLDAGSGVFAKLRAATDYAGIDAVVITHVHGDHFLDLIPFSYALTLSAHGRGGPEQKRPRLFAPPGGVETLRAVTSAWGSDGPETCLPLLTCKASTRFLLTDVHGNVWKDLVT